MAAIFDRLEAVLKQAPDLTTGYTVLYHRWDDAGTPGPLIAFRRSGMGTSDQIVQYPDVDIIIMTTPNAVQTGDQRAQDILRRFRAASETAGIVRHDPLAGVQGPFYTANGRPWWRMTIRSATVDQ